MAFAGGYPNSGSSGGAAAPDTVANTLDAADSAARLALAYGTADGQVQLGDIVRQVDTGAFYMLIGSTPSNSAHWQQLSALPASIIASGQLALARGGTGADLSATGGTGQVLKQGSAGGVVTVGALTAAEMPSGIDATKIADGSVTSTEFQYIGTLSSNAQTQLDAKAGLGANTFTAAQTISTNGTGSSSATWFGQNSGDAQVNGSSTIRLSTGNTTRVSVTSSGLASGLGSSSSSAPLHARAASGSQQIWDYSSGVNCSRTVNSSGIVTDLATGNEYRWGDISGYHLDLLISSNTLYMQAQGSNPVFAINVTGSYRAMTFSLSGGAPRVGFFNSTGQTQPVLATGAGHTVDDVIQLLQDYGLATQT